MSPSARICSYSWFFISERFTMTDLPSLPDELIERVGKHIIRSNEQPEFRDWCRLACTCKRLWDMQLPGSVSEWLEWAVNLDGNIEGEYKMACSSCATQLDRACASNTLLT